MFKGKIRKFIVFPIMSIEDSNGDIFREEKGKPFEIFTGNLPNLKQVAEQYEVKYERDYISKLNQRINIEKASSGRSSRIRGSGK